MSARGALSLIAFIHIVLVFFSSGLAMTGFALALWILVIYIVGERV